MRNYLSMLLIAVGLAFAAAPGTAQTPTEPTTLDQKARPGAVAAPAAVVPTTIEQAPAVALAQAEPTEPGGLAGFLQTHWVALVGLVLVLIEGVLRLTPSEADNSIFNLIKRIIDAVLPNRRQAGGTYK